MAYNPLKNGMVSGDVRRLQESLTKSGYDTGGIDGSFGAKTELAVRKYQDDNGLTVDGIAGDQTLSNLYGTEGQSTAPAEQTPSFDKTLDLNKYNYDPNADAAYMQALQALQNAQKELPSYKGTYDQQLNDLYDKIVNRDKFSYDVNADALYQQYKDQYVNLGQLAMTDTMGQAAAMTGGYGNSYAQNAGQQAYQSYLQQLNDKIPDLYRLSLDQYNQEGNQMLQQYQMLGDMADDEYGKYQDALNQYWKNLSFLQNNADEAYNRGYTASRDQAADAKAEYSAEYQKWQDDLAYQQWLTQFNYQKYQDALSRASRGSSGGTTRTNIGKDAIDALTDSVDKSADDINKKKADDINKKKPDTPAGEVFTGSTYSDACAFLEKNGYDISGVLDYLEWDSRRADYLRSGMGGPEGRYSTYQKYLKSYVEYKTEE